MKSYRELIEQTFEFPQKEFKVREHELLFNDVPLMDIIKQYGTPLKITYLPRISENIRFVQATFNNAIERFRYNGKYTYCYCTKSSHFSFVLEEAIVADFGIVRAWKGDRHGNLVYRESAQNFNPLAAMCGRVTIAEVEHLVEPGEIDPAEVHTPGVYVQRVVPLTPEQAADKRIEKRTVRPRGTEA